MTCPAVDLSTAERGTESATTAHHRTAKDVPRRLLNSAMLRTPSCQTVATAEENLFRDRPGNGEEGLTSTEERKTPEVVESVVDLDFAFRVEERFGVSTDDTAGVAVELAVGQARVVHVFEPATERELEGEDRSEAQVPVADGWERRRQRRRNVDVKMPQTVLPDLAACDEQGRQYVEHLGREMNQPSHQIIPSSSSMSPARPVSSSRVVF